MAETEEIVIFGAKVEGIRDVNSELEKVTKAIIEVKDENKGLVSELKALEKANKTNSKEFREKTEMLELNKKEVSELTRKQKDLITVIQTEANSIAGLRARNRELNQERNNLNLTTEKGQQRLKEINAELDRNNQVIKENVDSYTQQKIGIGDYSSALDTADPRVKQFIAGIKGTTAAAKAFIATPLGAAILAIAAAGAVFRTFLTGTQEGLDLVSRESARFNTQMDFLRDKVAAAGREIAVFAGLINEQEAEAGKSIFTWKNYFDVITFGFTAATRKVLNYAGVLDEINAVGEKAANLADAEAALRDEEIKNITVLKQIEADIAKARLNAREEDLFTAKERLGFINQAIEDSNRLIDKEKELLSEQIRIVEAQVGLTLSKAEAERKLQELKGREIDLEKKRFNDERTLLRDVRRLKNEISKENIKEVEEETEAVVENNDKQLEAIRQRERKATEIIQDEQLKREILLEEELEKRANLEVLAAFERSQRLLEDEELTNLERLAIQEKFETQKAGIISKFQKQIQQQADAQAARDEQREKMSAQIAIQARSSIALAVGQSLSTLGNLAKQNSLFQIALNIGNAIASTYAAANLALNTPPGPPVTVPSMIAAIGLGLGNVASIVAQQRRVRSLKDGGPAWGTIGGRRHSSGGTKFYGEDGSQFEAERGEGLFVLKRDAHTAYLSKLNQAHGGRSFFGSGSQRLAEGGRVETRQALRSITAQENTAELVSNIVSNMPPIFVAVEDINTGQNSVRVVEDRARVI